MTQLLKRLFLYVAHAWDKFWFLSKSDSDLVPIALFRIMFSLVMFFFFLSRTQDLAFFYTDAGILPEQYRQQVEYMNQYTIFSYFSSLTAIRIAHGMLLVSALFLAAGLWTRWSAILTYVLHVMFFNRNMTIAFGVDMISSFFLLYLCLADSGARLSIDAILRKRKQGQSTLGHMALRLMQLQLCVIYGYSGLEKLKGVRWWNGSAMWDVLCIGNLQRWDMSFLAHAPLVLSSVVYLVLFWEIYFPVLIWIPKMRLPMLAFGFVMHIGIFLFLNLPSFGFMMISIYILFLKREDLFLICPKTAKKIYSQA